LNEVKQKLITELGRIKLADGLRCPNVAMDAFANFVACCDFDLRHQNLTRSSVEANSYSL